MNSVTGLAQSELKHLEHHMLQVTANREGEASIPANQRVTCVGDESGRGDAGRRTLWPEDRRTRQSRCVFGKPSLVVWWTAILLVHSPDWHPC